jgi:Fe-S-cluster containining protein
MDAAFADAAARSGKWLKCREGCTQCCVGVFAISQLDAARLREGMAQLEHTDPKRAERVRRRARQSLKRLKKDFPGDPTTGILDHSQEAQARFEEFGNNETCPALDPKTGRCDVYQWRPMTCRVFGPPVRTEEGLGVCELCYKGAKPAQIAACEMQVPHELEERLIRQAEKKSGKKGETIVAWCLGQE